MVESFPQLSQQNHLDRGKHELINPFSTRREFSLRAAFNLAVSALKTDLKISQQLAQIYVSEGDSFQVIKKACVRLWLALLRKGFAYDVYLPKI